MTKKRAHVLRRLLATWLLPCSVLAASAASAATAGFGVMVHYLPDKHSIADVARFDVDAFAESLEQMRASHLILTLGQNNGQYIAPNAALEKLCPQSAANRPPRDLPLEIGRALRARGIALVLYLPFRAPQSDPYLMECLGDISEQQPPPAPFIGRWAAVIRDWSERYGTLASGWWFDGVYNTTGVSAEGWNALCGAARSGAAKRWLAFNAGEGPERYSVKAAPCQNLMAGEFMQPPAQPAGTEAGLTFHVLTPLGASWGRPTPPRFTADQVRGWIAVANARGGLFTLDLPLDADFRFLPSHVALIRNATAPRTRALASIAHYKP
ncbi:hypothetical protein [Variovorax sp. OV700]|jgi:hypothetical protein|uniref:hypothetical protein n=1 Tax=Variovorax sp. OV700 TaxID=1882826 RepID=UPI00088FC63B|nr:hypothetical protein [Variovorax sp. OV700]SDI48806.1 hypothetical protein SAMN05444748_105313 [Variovorax sp. OV700]